MLIERVLYVMRVLVVGANGKVARYLLSELKNKGHEPVAMVRNEEQGPELRERGASDIVVANLEEDFSHAFASIDAVVFAAGSGPHTGADKTILIDLWGAIKTIQEAEKRGIKRFIMVSSVGTVDPDQGPMNMRHYLVAKRLADDELKRSSLDYTIVRPGPLSNEESTGKVTVSPHFSEITRSITRHDVAKVIAELVDQQHTIGKTFEVLNGDTPIAKVVEQIGRAHV